MTSGFDVSRGIEKVPITLRDQQDADKVKDFVYTLCNVAGINNRAVFEDRFAGCTCSSSAHDGLSPPPPASSPTSPSSATSPCTSGCGCLQGYGVPYDESGRLCLVGAEGTHHPPVFECHRLCSCGSSCATRVVQKGITHHLQVFNTEHKGFGLATRDAIPVHSFVCEYAGEVLTRATAAQRAAAYRMEENNHNFYIFVLREHVGSIAAIANSSRLLQTYVDPTYIGNAARFINHSCAPNLHMVPVRDGCAVPRLALFAKRDISPGEELTFDYSGGVQHAGDANSETDDQLEARHRDRQSRRCHCGASMCNGYLPYDDTLLNLQDRAHTGDGEGGDNQTNT